jgi:hypothetical protein
LFQLIDFQFHLIDSYVFVSQFLLQFLIEHDDFVLFLNGVEIIPILKTAQCFNEFIEFFDVFEWDIIFFLFEDEHFSELFLDLFQLDGSVLFLLEQMGEFTVSLLLQTHCLGHFS